MSDNYEFMKTTESQDAEDYSPHIHKQYRSQYINDINDGVCTNNSSTSVNFDLDSIYNSQKNWETGFIRSTSNNNGSSFWCWYNCYTITW